MEEQWKMFEIHGFKPLWVSSEGRVMLLSGRLTFGGRTYQGYRQVSLRTLDGKREKHLLVHRMVAISFVANPNDFPFVNHIDGRKSNSAATNLEWCDAEKNAQHASRIGLLQHGETHRLAKLTEERVQKICEWRAEGWTLAALAHAFGVSQGHIGLLARGKRWTHRGRKVTVGTTE